MQEIILDFTKCKKAMEKERLYQVLKEAFKFPFDFGNNPNALWDVMRDYWANDEDIHFKMYGVYDLEYRYLQMEMEYIIEVFEDLSNKNPNVTFEIVS